MSHTLSNLGELTKRLCRPALQDLGEQAVFAVIYGKYFTESGRGRGGGELLGTWFKSENPSSF